MERLTEWNIDHTHGQMAKHGDAYTRLAEYEDTGLTPEEVADLKVLLDMYGGEDGITAAFMVQSEYEKIVRCKDCTNATVSMLINGGKFCRILRRQIDENDFCSYGEKKGE